MGQDHAGGLNVERLADLHRGIAPAGEREGRIAAVVARDLDQDLQRVVVSAELGPGDGHGSHLVLSRRQAMTQFNHRGTEDTEKNTFNAETRMTKLESMPKHERRTSDGGKATDGYIHRSAFDIRHADFDSGFAIRVSALPLCPLCLCG